MDSGCVPGAPSEEADVSGCEPEGPRQASASSGSTSGLGGGGVAPAWPFQVSEERAWPGSRGGRRQQQPGAGEASASAPPVSAPPSAAGGGDPMAVVDPSPGQAGVGPEGHGHGPDGQAHMPVQVQDAGVMTPGSIRTLGGARPPLPPYMAQPSGRALAILMQQIMANKGEEGSVITVDVDGTLLSVIIAKISKHYIYYMNEGCPEPEGRRAGKWTYFFGASEKGSSRKQVFCGQMLGPMEQRPGRVIAGVVRYNKVCLAACPVWHWRQDWATVVHCPAAVRKLFLMVL
jgi:hypothetical protein